MRELRRVLKRGGVLVMTVDFSPMTEDGGAGQFEYRMARLAGLARRGNFVEILRGGARKVGAQWSVVRGVARKPRSANECFAAEHLELDVLLLMTGPVAESGLDFPCGLRSVTRRQARELWDLRPGLFDLQGRRDVLPAAIAILRASA